MKNKHYPPRKLSLLIFICLLTLSSTWAQKLKQAPDKEQKTTKNALHEGSNRLSSKSGVPFTINRTDESFIIRFAQASGINKENFFSFLQDSLGKNTDGKHRLLKTITDKEHNLTTYRYQQFYKNIPVEYSLINLHERERTLETATGTYYAGLQIDTTPSLTAGSAIQAAMASVKAGSFNWLNPDMEQFIKREKVNNKATYYPTTDLIISRDYSLSEVPDNFKLCYKIKINTYEPTQALEVYVDAHTGKIISSNDIITHCATRAPHTGADHSHLPKSIISSVPTKNPATSVTANNADTKVSNDPLWGSGTTLYSGVQQFPTETDPVTNVFRLESGPARQNYIVRNMLNRSLKENAIDFVRALKPGSNNSNWTSTTAKLTTIKFKFTEMPGSLAFENCNIRIQDISNTIIFEREIENFKLNQEYNVTILRRLPLLSGTDYTITLYDKNDSLIASAHLEANSGLVQFNIVFNNTIIGTGSVEATAGTSGALDVAFGINKTLDYFKNVHGRNGYDNLNGRITAYVHPSIAVMAAGNASFLAGVLIVGESTNTEGPACSLDITAHEITHGVVETSAGLSYKRGTESASLNESFADIFGTAVEFNTPSAGSPNWLYSEGIYGGVDYERSMGNPKAKGQPDFYKGSNWEFTTASSAHKNGGVQNRWFYLLSEGGSGTNEAGDNYNVQGIGIKKAEKIAYRSLTNYLQPTSDYKHAYESSLLAAADLYRKNSPEYQSVADAWDAVGLPGKMKITSFTPKIGVAAEPGIPGTEVTITGENFIGVTDIKFNDTFIEESSFSVNQDYTQIIVRVPKGATTGKITLIAGKHEVKTATDFYIGKPTITSFMPTKGFASTDSEPGTEITINGENFIEATAVYFGETLVEQSSFKISDDGTTITATVPKGAVTDPIKVVRNDEAFGISKEDFTVVSPPTITSFSPSSGFATTFKKEGTTVEIEGTFECVTKIFIGNTEVTNFKIDKKRKKITAIVPTGATTGKITLKCE